MIDDEGIDLVVKKGLFITPSLLWSLRYTQFADSWDYANGPFPIGDGFPETFETTQKRLAAVHEDFEYTKTIVPKMQEAGVKLLVGDDFGFPR